MNALAPSAPGVLATLAGVTAPVCRRTYALAGFGLMALKYAVEAAVVALLIGSFYSPVAFLSPVMTVRAAALGSAADMVTLPYLLWNLPFAWVGATMTVRRARDAGLPALFGLAFFIPLVNFLVMLGLCALPTRPPASSVPAAGVPATGAPFSGVATAHGGPGPLGGEERVVYAALTGVAAGTAVGMVSVIVAVYGLGEYGGALFLGAPVVMGTVSGFLLNLRGRRTLLANVAVAGVTCFSLGGLMMLTAMEGLICLAMAAPIGLAMTGLGVLLGAALAQVEGGRMVRLMGLGWPAALLLSPAPGGSVRQVESSVVIAAGPEAVWDAVIGFGGVELPPPPEWYFRLGIAYPVRAWIEGTAHELGGAGAVRYCEFSTGPFVEPIRVWQPPVDGGLGRLAFDVTESPATMKEWSVYSSVHAPHLDGILKSRQGEFIVESQPDGTTRLVGRTWYTFAMAPEPYWGLWSDLAIQRIHKRVLEHIRGVAEAA
ncbi:MAG: hypothetical protein EXR69_04935 [Myxococcales bacterium]|nr:hypothetical protein [Myxococcales bacterium]